MKELLSVLQQRRLLWIAPLVFTLLAFGILVFFGRTIIAGPFIYMRF